MGTFVRVLNEVKACSGGVVYLPPSVATQLLGLLRRGEEDATARQRRHAARAAVWLLLALLLVSPRLAGAAAVCLALVELFLAACFCEDEKSAMKEQQQQLWYHLSHGEAYADFSRLSSTPPERPWMEQACSCLGGNAKNYM